MVYQLALSSRGEVLERRLSQVYLAVQETLGMSTGTLQAKGVQSLGGCMFYSFSLSPALSSIFSPLLVPFSASSSFFCHPTPPALSSVIPPL